MATISELYETETETELSDLDITIPSWIDQGLTTSDVAAICEGGCASGAYMPAVTYYDARQTMADYGDDVLDYIQNALGELPAPTNAESWSGIAVHYLSIAVELWAQSTADEIVLEAVEE